MEFDHLLRKYLAGSISDMELKRFRDLLDRSPEYRLELRQTLELRSLIQDDALGLAPPEDLSERVRFAVSEQFATESVARREHEERRRRAGIFPFRIGAGVMATTFVALMVAIGPSLIQRFGDNPATSARSSIEITVPEGDVTDAGTSRKESAEMAATFAPRVTVPSHVLADALRSRSRREALTVSVADGGTAAIDRLVSVTDQGERETEPRTVAEPVITPSEAPLKTEDRALLDRLAAMGMGNRANVPYQPSAADQKSAAALATVETGREILPQLEGGSDARRLTVGVSLGSGRVTETTSPTPLMQNSYYFAFSISSNDRIGLEMGNSAFQQNRSVASFSAPGSGFVKGGKGAAAKLTSAGDVSDDSQNPTLSNRQMTVVESRAEQQITYGTIFYDRRLPIGNDWDLCGRIGVGAADNALVGHVRAYAAFSPSKKVTLTFGVGGSGLKSLNSRGPEGSGNYGIFYGIETGF